MARIATIDELMDYLDVGGDNAARVPGAVLGQMLSSAERWAENYAHRIFAPDPPLVDGEDTAVEITKTFLVRHAGRVRIPDLRSASVVAVGGTAVTENIDYELDTFTGEEPHTSIRLVSVTPFSSPFFSALNTTLSITGRWGFSPPPDDVKDAVLRLAARQYRKRDSMYSDQVDTGTGAFDYRRGMPEDVREILDLYRVPNVAVV